MRLFNHTFFRYLTSFALVLLVSFLFLLATNHLMAKGRPGEPEMTCITSSGEPC